MFPHILYLFVCEQRVKWQGYFVFILVIRIRIVFYIKAEILIYLPEFFGGGLPCGLLLAVYECAGEGSVLETAIGCDA